MKHHDRRLIPRTLLQIFTYVAITTLVMVVSLAGILYRDYEKIGLRTAYEYNIRYLRQISYNIAQMNDFIVQYCITQYSEPDMQNFLYTSEIGDAFYFNYIKSIGKLQNTVLISPMIHSVVVYNSYLDKVYSTSPFFSNEDTQLRELFTNTILYEVLRPVPRIITNDLYYRDKGVLDEKIKLFTYILTENNYRGKSESALAVNIDTKWIFNNLKEPSGGNGDDGSKLLLIDSTGMVIADESNAAREFELLFLVHIKYLTDVRTGLLFHGWTFIQNNHFAGALWGRGNSWYTAGLVDFLDIVRPSEGIERFLVSTLFTQVSKLKELQDASGLWHTLLDDPSSYLETSASAAFAYGILKAVRKGYLRKEFIEVGKKALDAVISKIDEAGIVQDVSYGTPVFKTTEEYKNVPLCPMPYGQSMALILLVEALKWTW